MHPAILILALVQADDGADALERFERELAAVVENTRRSVVGITASFTTEIEPRRPTTTWLKLSGVVYSADGHVLTDGRELVRAAEIQASLSDGRDLSAQLLGYDPPTGVAVVKIDAEGLSPASLADSDAARSGSWAIIVGHSLGLGSSADVGFVGGTGRSIVVGGRRYEEMLQLTTAARPGDCGGFVADARGRLLGLVHSAFDGKGGEPDIVRLFREERVRPLSFATPASEVRFAADRIIKDGRVTRGRMGIHVRPLDEATRKPLSIPEGEGCEVWSVDQDGPAAGVLRRRDVLLRVDGRPVRDVRALRRWVAGQDRARKVPVAFLRGGDRQEAQVEIQVE